jgi:hypothetical protein
MVVGYPVEADVNEIDYTITNACGKSYIKRPIVTPIQSNDSASVTLNPNCLINNAMKVAVSVQFTSKSEACPLSGGITTSATDLETVSFPSTTETAAWILGVAYGNFDNYGCPESLTGTVVYQGARR